MAAPAGRRQGHPGRAVLPQWRRLDRLVARAVPDRRPGRAAEHDVQVGGARQGAEARRRRAARRSQQGAGHRRRRAVGGGAARSCPGSGPDGSRCGQRRTCATSGWSVARTEAGRRTSTTRPPHVPRDVLAAVEAEVSPADLAIMVHTSGSTADPKGVLHTHGTLVRQTSTWPTAIRSITGSAESARILCAMPFFWIGGVLAATGALHEPVTVLAMPRLDAATALDLVEQRARDRHRRVARLHPAVAGPPQLRQPRPDQCADVARRSAGHRDDGRPRRIPRAPHHV